MNYTEKIAKILFAVFVMVFSFTVLTQKVPEMEYVQSTINSLEDSQQTIMTFSGTTIAISMAISALPDDFASPLADTVADLNTYFIFMLAVIFIEKLIVIEGTKIALVYIIPMACVLYVMSVLTSKAVFKSFATKLLIFGISLVVVIPFSTHFTETVCADYLVYVDETIAEADAGAEKVNEVMNSDNTESTFFEKISDAFKNAIQDMADLLTYFRNVVKKCANSVAIMLVTTFVLPILILVMFRWLLKELFSLHIPVPEIKIRKPKRIQKTPTEETQMISMED